MTLFGKLFQIGKAAPDLPVHPDDRDLISETDAGWWQGVTVRKLELFRREDAASRVVLINSQMKYGGMTKEAARRHSMRTLPWFYGSLEERGDESLGLAPEDAGLPWVLKNRVVEAIMVGDIKKGDLRKSSSMNALIRRLVREGRI